MARLQPRLVGFPACVLVHELVAGLCEPALLPRLAVVGGLLEGCVGAPPIDVAAGPAAWLDRLLFAVVWPCAAAVWPYAAVAVHHTSQAIQLVFDPYHLPVLRGGSGQMVLVLGEYCRDNHRHVVKLPAGPKRDASYDDGSCLGNSELLWRI